MLDKAKGFGAFLFGLAVLALCLSGCAQVEKIAKYLPTKTRGDDRAIDVIQKMRTQAVSQKIGRWAVVIGVSDYKYDTRWDRAKGIPDLRFANRDAKAFAQFLMSPQGGAFPPNHVLLLTDRKATIKEVRKAIGDFLARSLEDDLVIIFYAGHGTPDPKNPDNLYLACYDTEPGNYYGTALPMWEIDTALERTIRSNRVFVFADACHSAGVGGRQIGGVSKQLNEYMERLAASKEGVTKVTASRSDEVSQEREELGGGHGVFTYYLLEALRGEGDENRDGFVTMAEAYDYLYDRVRSETRHSQNPWASAYVSPDIPLGIVDGQALAAIEARSEAQKQKPVQPVKPYRPQPIVADLPEDSSVAVKLARAKLAKDEPGIAKEMVEGVLRRNDDSKPDALALVIEILLRDGDLKEAEDREDRMVIPYPEHQAAMKGARLVYDYYINNMKGTTPAEEIRQIETYLKRHSGGLLEKEAEKRLEGVRFGIMTRYRKGFDESLVLAKGFINQNRFDRARKELDRAEEKAKEALSDYAITLDTKRVAEIRLKAEREEQQFQNEKAYQEAKHKAGQQTLEEKIKTWQDFTGKNPGNPYIKDAENELLALRNKGQAQLQTRYDRLLSDANTSLGNKDFARALEKLDTATALLRKAVDKLGISLSEGNIYQIRERHRAEAEKHRDYIAWNKADSEAKAVRLDDTSDYDHRISIYEDFQNKWQGSPYRSNAQQTVSELKQQKAAFMERKFREYFGRAKEDFIAKNYTGAYQSLENAKEYATSGQKRDIDELDSRYNAPPEVRIVLDSDTIDWETPVQFKYRAEDKDGDPVRIVSWDFGDGTSGREDNPRHSYAKWGDSQKERQYLVTLKATDGHTTVEAKKTITVKRQDQDCVDRDGRFCALANGTVLDTKTGLMWASKDNGGDINWQDAKRYCENYRGGGYTDWRMPTQDELAGIYDESKKNRHGYRVTKLIEITRCCPWASETHGSKAAFLNFTDGGGVRGWDGQSNSYLERALPVRSGN